MTWQVSQTSLNLLQIIFINLEILTSWDFLLDFMKSQNENDGYGRSFYYSWCCGIWLKDAIIRGYHMGDSVIWFYQTDVGVISLTRSFLARSWYRTTTRLIQIISHCHPCCNLLLLHQDWGECSEGWAGAWGGVEVFSNWKNFSPQKTSSWGLKTPKKFYVLFPY